MPCAKAADLLRVAGMAMSRFDEIALQDRTAAFGCDHRSEQRMMRCFETVFRSRAGSSFTRRRRPSDP
ncbi:MAG: hypothetical protein EP320_10225 [Rhodobacteraceae bacterium]|nr:MAG: hypothetical protein EP320_10225 [Paracoccaceae bacterium]